MGGGGWGVRSEGGRWQVNERLQHVGADLERSQHSCDLSAEWEITYAVWELILS